MSRYEFVSDAGLRLDGRRPPEIRRLRARLGAADADGSAYLEMGGTRVLATVFGPQEPTSRGERRHDRASLFCECSIAPYSGIDHKRRFPGDRFSSEIALAVRDTLASALHLHLYRRSELRVHVAVLQLDGGALAACVNAAALAAADAGVAMSDLPVACTAGFVDQHVLTDLSHMESGVGVDLCMASLPALGDAMPLLLMDAKASVEVFERLLEAAQQGCERVYDALKAVLREETTLRVARASEPIEDVVGEAGQR